MMRPMNRQTTLPMPGAEPNEVSAEAVLQSRLAELGQWLTAQGLDLTGDEAHIDEGSRDRLYWRYGYFTGLKQALEMLT